MPTAQRRLRVSCFPGSCGSREKGRIPLRFAWSMLGLLMSPSGAVPPDRRNKSQSEGFSSMGFTSITAR